MKKADPNKFLGGFDASELMTMGTARELPELEERFTELKAKVHDMEVTLDNFTGPETREIAELQLIYRQEVKNLERLKQQVEFAQSCANYVKEVMGREPY